MRLESAYGHMKAGVKLYTQDGSFYGEIIRVSHKGEVDGTYSSWVTVETASGLTAIVSRNIVRTLFVDIDELSV